MTTSSLYSRGRAVLAIPFASIDTEANLESLNFKAFKKAKALAAFSYLDKETAQSTGGSTSFCIKRGSAVLLHYFLPHED